MFDLPILKTEARALARQWPAYRARAVFGLMLLVVFWFFHQSHESWSTGRLSSLTELAEFGAAAFEWLAVGQAIVLLVLVPATVAGAVAEARSRQTLPGLLASPLSSAAIIGDLLAAQMLPVGIVLAIGLPLAALLGLLGGVDHRSVIYAYAGTLSTTFFVAALSLLISVYSRRPFTAVLHAYGIEFLWLVGPWIGKFVLVLRAWLRPLASVNSWIEPTTPLSLVGPWTYTAWSGGGPIQLLAPPPMRGPWRGSAVLTTPVAWMVGLQLAYGLALVVLAAWRLRPVARRLADSPTPRTLFGRLRVRRRPLPACGDDAMLWKECYPAADRPSRLGLWLALLAFGWMTFVYSGVFAYRYPLALDEFFRSGYSTGPRGNNGFMRMAFFEMHLAKFSVMFYAVALVAVIVESASGISREREARTWEGLLATPLEPAEIIRAKVLGAIFRQRVLVALVFGPWLVGLVLWALHPLGLLLATAGLAAFLWFAAAVGTLFSLRSETSVEALVKTLCVLLALNVGTLFAGRLLAGSNQASALFGNTFVLLSFLPFSTHELSRDFVRPIHIWRELLFVGFLLTYVAAYAALAWSRSRVAIREFDRVADRPRIARAARGWKPSFRLTLLRGGGHTTGSAAAPG
jgi:ABC-type transport system involved in multi-copper enzyme maturation permease subunit